MRCQHCGDDLPASPEDAVRSDGRALTECVSHTFEPDGFGLSQTDYYCDPKCLAAEVSDNE